MPKPNKKKAPALSPVLVSIKEAATYLGVSKPTVVKLYSCGKLSFHYDPEGGKIVRVYKDSLDNYLRDHKQTGAY